MSKVRSKMASPLPWWLSEGEEECPHCGLLYAIEVEFRCPECDGPSCPHCRIRHAEALYICPACVEGAAGGEGREHG